MDGHGGCIGPQFFDLARGGTNEASFIPIVLEVSSFGSVLRVTALIAKIECDYQRAAVHVAAAVGERGRKIQFRRNLVRRHPDGMNADLREERNAVAEIERLVRATLRLSVGFSSRQPEIRTIAARCFL